MNSLLNALRESAQGLLTEAIGLELDHFLRGFAHLRCADGHQVVVRNGYHPQRSVVTGIGPVFLRMPKIRTRAGPSIPNRNGHSLAFRSALVPAYQRRTCESVALGALPAQFLRGVASQDSVGALTALLGRCPNFIPPSLRLDIDALWVRLCSDRFSRPLSGKPWQELRVEVIRGGDGNGSANRSAGECILVAVGVDDQGCAQLLLIRSCSGETSEDWSKLLHDLKSRGFVLPRQISTGGGATQLAEALGAVFPQSGSRLVPGANSKSGTEIEVSL